ncbi:MAG: PilT/PilU family type 4a pilus ATPase [Thermodesulfobacteriota bacterium]
MRKQEIDYILGRMLDAQGNVSDLNITVGKPFQVECDGQLLGVQMDPPVTALTPFQTEIFALNLINQDQRLTESLLARGACDFSYELPGTARFRVNIFSQRGRFSIVLRRLETRIPSIGDISLPDVFYRMADEKNGIILVTGATGSGKSTSIAALLNEINEHKSVHVITLEDPVEFSHPHKMATFNQREMGNDFDTFANGLRAALRQAPKVILVGEIRDRETVEIALSAAETGHLVLSTLHTINAGQTINRILGMFTTEEEAQIRARLSDTVRWIVCQRLLPREGGGRVAAFEVMGSNIRVKDAILHGESEGKLFQDIIQAGGAFGMVTFDDSIVELYRRGLIDEKTARAYASSGGQVGRGIDTIKSGKGQATTDLGRLEVDRDYGKPARKL